MKKHNRQMWYRYLRNNPIKILEGWDEDLIWCPSQCYLSISFKGKTYIIYLRWRWSDPWSCELIPLIEGGTYARWGLHSHCDEEWIYILICLWIHSCNKQNLSHDSILHSFSSKCCKVFYLDDCRLTYHEFGTF